jgi:hypothetical protein
LGGGVPVAIRLISDAMIGDDNNRSKTYSRRADAKAADAEIIRRMRLGTLAELDAGRETLDEFVQGVWAPVHAAHLSPRTRATHSVVYAKHIGPYLGGFALRSLTADVIAVWQAAPEVRCRPGEHPQGVSLQALYRTRTDDPFLTMPGSRLDVAT